MLAIVRTGGKQYRVAAGDKIAVEKLAGEAGETITLGDILLAGKDGELAVTLTAAENVSVPLLIQGMPNSEAVALAAGYRTNESPQTVVDFDKGALEPTFQYFDDDKTMHEVWFLDASDPTGSNRRWTGTGRASRASSTGGPAASPTDWSSVTAAIADR